MFYKEFWSSTKVAERYKQQSQNAKEKYKFKNKKLAEDCNVERLARKVTISDIEGN